MVKGEVCGYVLWGLLTCVSNVGTCVIETEEHVPNSGEAVMLCDGELVNAVPVQPGVCSSMLATDALCALRLAVGLPCRLCFDGGLQ